MLEQHLESITKRHNLQKYVVKNTDNYYAHMTFSINSLSDFIDLAGKLSSALTKSSMGSLLYRGMANSDWKLIPSILRVSAKKDKSFNLEHDFAMNIISEMPKLFENSNSNFENLSKMQHFGIPTRLLDFTLNPLIALYFACSERPTKTGRVAFTMNTLHYFNDPIVECISSMYLRDSFMNIPLDEWIEPYKISASDYMFNTYSYWLESSPLFVKPIYLDRRMEVQRSVFLLFHNYLRDFQADRTYDGSEHKKISMDLTKECISAIYEDQIENPISSFGKSPSFIVTKETFDNLCMFYREYDKQKYLENINDALSSRFLFVDHIQGLEVNDIWYNFSSILIPAKKKKNILYELQNIGIDEAFVYPEAEYVAERIKKFYT